ncbi:CATRA system-associated protein [Streptomyces galilaeus]
MDDVRAWQLTGDGWGKVHEVLALLVGAVDEGRLDDTRRALTLLKTCSPVRVVRDANPAMAQPPPTGGLPQDVGELVNHVVHSLGLPEPTPPPAAGGSGPAS